MSIRERKGKKGVSYQVYFPYKKKFRKLHVFIQFHTSPQLHNIGVLRMKTLSYIAMAI